MLDAEERLDNHDRRIEWVNDHTWRWGYWRLRLSGPRRLLILGAIDTRSYPIPTRPSQEPVKPTPH